MSNEPMKETSTEQTDLTSGTCKACGTTLAGVTEEEYDRMFAEHVLYKHGDEAPESVLDEAREVLDE